MTSPAATATLAAAPIGLILALMLGLRWSAARAGLAGLALAAVLATTVFGFGSPNAIDGAPASTPREFAGVFAEGGFLAGTILWILLPALALHHHQQRCGALDALREGLARLTPERPLQALLVGWFLALFLEGAAGFGTPVALAAPILVGLGVPAVQAVVLALLGHAAGVSFGALGTPVAAQVALTGLDPVAIAWNTALLHALLGSLLMVFFMRTLAAAGMVRPPVGWAALAAAGFLLPCLAIAATIGPALATLGAALAGSALFIAVLVQRRTAPHMPPAAGIGRALWPYGVLVALVLATRLPALAQPLGEIVLQWQLFDRYGASMQPLMHPGTLLFAALLVGARLQRVPLRDLAGPLALAAKRLLPVTAALLAMLCLSRLMLHAGMIAALQEAAVRGVGRGWPLVAPAVGALGSFVTGSATASNVLFTTLQAQTAQALSLSPTALVAAQGLGAAIGNIVSPHNIIAGAATVGLAGREAEILRRTLWPCAIYLALGGLLVAWLAAG
ncbi:L-lactate permease [Piscinibacter sp.]|uniref:L-lactate permease n=1 Tax=Piscinibacter sp. TaxID=1903157 RepID=UPI002BA115DC|nr:L-lactate permease [Albitalea sp.]HUG24638.1 L-lactate permease [Albitalea sp.]